MGIRDRANVFAACFPNGCLHAADMAAWSTGVLDLLASLLKDLDKLLSLDPVYLLKIYGLQLARAAGLEHCEKGVCRDAGLLFIRCKTVNRLRWISQNGDPAVVC
jgi:hypothetical protein